MQAVRSIELQQAGIIKFFEAASQIFAGSGEGGSRFVGKAFKLGFGGEVLDNDMQCLFVETC